MSAWESKVDRWLDLETFNYSARYRSTFDADGARAFDQGQERLLADGTFKFDPQGRYGIGFHLSSGRYFNWSYSDFIGGGQHSFLQNTEARMTPTEQYIMNLIPPANGFYNSGGGELYFRQAFLALEPIRGIQLQGGGLAINHGVNTEATSYDDDGYISGERVSIKRNDKFWLSEVSYTRAFLGEFYTPNFFARAEDLSKQNYWQILGRKDFGKRVSVSADYTLSTPKSLVPIPSVPYTFKVAREGIFTDVHESRVLDAVRLEAYQRINSTLFSVGTPIPAAKGYALTLTRSYKKRLSLDAGIADIDLGYIANMGYNLQAIELGLTVNGDQYGVGRRYFVRPTVPLTSYLSLVGNYNHLFDSNLVLSGYPIDVWNAQYFTAGFVFDAKKLLFQCKRSKFPPLEKSIR